MWCWPPALPRPPGCLRCLPMRPWPADTEPRFLRFLLNRVSGCVGEGGISYGLSRGRCVRVGLAPPSVGVCGSRSESSRPARCFLGAVPRPALAMLLPAAAGVGGGGLLGRRAPRSSARPGLCSSRLSLAFFGGPRARIAAARASSVYESAIIRLRTPIHAMVASVQLLSMRSRSATIVWVLGAGPVSDAVPRSRTARRTALQTANGSWRFELASVKTLGASGVHLAASRRTQPKH